MNHGAQIGIEAGDHLERARQQQQRNGKRDHRAEDHGQLVSNSRAEGVPSHSTRSVAAPEATPASPAAGATGRATAPAMATPHLGQAAARSDTDCWHSGQAIKAICPRW
jgi:hypothetical protein